MQRLDVSGAVRPIYGSLGFKRLNWWKLWEMIPGVLPMTPKTKRQNSEFVGVTSPRLKKLKFKRLRIKTKLIILFDSEGIVHKEFVLERKTVNAEFYKGAIDCLLKCISRVHPAAFCCRDFSCYTITCPHTKLQVFANFWPKKSYNPLSPRTLQIYLCQTIFRSPSWKWIKMTPLCGCCKDPRSRYGWIKEGPKRGILNSFSENVRTCKSLYICQRSLFWIKKRCLPHVSSIFKKINSKTFGPQCVYEWNNF